MCFSKFVDWGRGEGKKKKFIFNLCIFVKLYWVILLLKILGINCIKELSLKAFCGVYYFCNCIMYFFVVLSDKDIKLINI